VSDIVDWQPIPKPAEIAENRLLEAILSGRFPIHSSLPGERELAARVGVTRPTLREALQRLGRDGWLDIQHGKPTRVRDYWREGSLAVLGALARASTVQPPDFVANLLEIRLLLAPEYTRQALQASPEPIMTLLFTSQDMPDDPVAFTRLDWALHQALTRHATNPVFCLLLNSFQGVYHLVGERYFSCETCRRHSRTYYDSLLACARRRAPGEAADLTRRVMQESLVLWRQTISQKE
jgi:GntR family negative regulator for fad regulon and positive regulator of fabA